MQTTPSHTAACLQGRLQVRRRQVRLSVSPPRPSRDADDRSHPPAHVQGPTRVRRRNVCLSATFLRVVILYSYYMQYSAKTASNPNPAKRTAPQDGRSPRKSHARPLTHLTS